MKHLADGLDKCVIVTVAASSWIKYCVSKIQLSCTPG